MVYKRVIERNGKRYEYYYENYRDENGVVRNKFIGKEPPLKHNSHKSSKRILSLFFFFLFIGFSIYTTTSLVQESSFNLGNAVGFAIQEGSEFTEKKIYQQKSTLEIKAAEGLLFENKNKRMDFSIGTEEDPTNIRLYFDLVDYDKVVSEVEQIIEEESNPPGNVVSSLTGFVTRITGFVVGSENETNASESEPSVDDVSLNIIDTEKVSQKIEELDEEEIEDIIDLSVVEAENFDIELEETPDIREDYKWTYKVKLDDLDFLAKVTVTSDEQISIWDNESLRIGNSVLSFSDLVAEGYTVRIERPKLRLAVKENLTEPVEVLNDTLVELENETVIESFSNETNETTLENETGTDVETNVSTSIGGGSSGSSQEPREEVIIGENETSWSDSSNSSSEEVVVKENETSVEEPSSSNDSETSEEVVVEEDSSNDEIGDSAESIEEVVVAPADTQEEKKEEKAEAKEEKKEEKAEAKETSEEPSEDSLTGQVISNIAKISGLAISSVTQDLKYQNTYTIYIERDFRNTTHEIGDIISLDPTLIIIEITDAWHLDSNRSVVSNIYEDVKEQDNNWTSVIGDGEFVRVRFEEPLDNENDITIHARGYNGSDAIIEVYENNSDNLIAIFENINEEETKQIFLTNLSNDSLYTQNTFDLKVIGAVEFDYIVDPSVSVATVSDVLVGPGNRNIVRMDSGKLVAVYESDVNDGACAESTDNGLTWTEYKSSDTSSYNYFSVATNGTLIYIVADQPGQGDLAYNYNHGGCPSAGWSLTDLSGYTSGHGTPSIEYDGFNNKFVMCHADNNNDLAFSSISISTTYTAWGEVEIEDAVTINDGCSISVDFDGDIHICAAIDNGAGGASDDDVRYYRSDDYFVTQSEVVLLNNDNGPESCDISARDGRVVVVTLDSGNDLWTYYSTDDGGSFTSTQETDNYQYPSVCLDSRGIAHILVSDFDFAPDELGYLNFTPTAYDSAAITSIATAAGDVFLASQICHNWPEHNRMTDGLIEYLYNDQDNDFVNFSNYSLGTSLNHEPKSPTVLLQTASGNNGTNENLTLTITGSTDSDGDSITNITDWRLNGTSITTLNLPFNSNISTIVKDYSINDVIGTQINGSTWVSGGISGGAYDFDGTNDYIDIPWSSANQPTSEVTVEAWVKSNSQSKTQIITRAENEHPSFFGWGILGLHLTSAGKVQFNVPVSGGFCCNIFPTTGTVTVTQDNWHHIVGTYTESEGIARLYVDGVLDTSTSGGGSTMNFQDYNLHIGAELGAAGSKPNANLFDGIIDEVRIYNKSLTALQIKSNYNDGLANRSVETLVSNMTNQGENWSVEVTSNDGEVDSNETRTYNITIGAAVNTAPTAPTLEINSTSLTNRTTENLTVYMTGSIDSEGDPFTNITDWRVDGNSLAVLNFPFDTNSTSTANDYSTYNYDGTAVGTFEWIPNGQVGGALEFDGSGYMSTGLDWYDQLYVHGGFSVEAWVNNTGGAAWNEVVRSFSGGPGTYAGLLFRRSGADGDFDCSLFNVGASNTVSGTLGTNEYAHWVCTYDLATTTLRLYKNGVEVGTADTSATSSDPGTNILVGNTWVGPIDEVRLYNRTLTPEQIKLNYQAGLAGHSPEIIVSNETAFGETWSVEVTPNDGSSDGFSTTTSLTILSTPPSGTTLVFNSTLGANRTDENLTVYPSGTIDVDNQVFTNITDWRVNGTSIAVLNLPFDTNNSTGVRDYSSHGNNGSVGSTSATWNASGVVGGAYDFDGVTQNITIPSSSSLDNARNPFTLELWVRTDNTAGTDYIIDRANSIVGTVFRFTEDGSGNIDYFMTIHNGSFQNCVLSDIGTLDSNWHHIAVVKNLTHIEGYFDGSLIQTDGCNAAPVGSGPVVIGELWSSGGNFEGSIDEIRLWDRALTSAQIKENYQAVLGGKGINMTISDETVRRENWTVAVTPNDGYHDGPTVVSYNLPINTPPTGTTFIFNSTSGTNTTNENLTVYLSGTTDVDYDSFTNITDWKRNGTSVAFLNMPFNTPNITGMKDYSSYGNNGTVNGASWTLAGRVGGAYEFNTSSYLTVDNESFWDGSPVGEIGRTYSAWIYRKGSFEDTDGLGGAIISKGAASSAGYILYIANDREVSAKIGSIVESSGLYITNNTWHHVAWVVNSNASLDFYLDGVKGTQQTFTYSGNNDWDLRIGNVDKATDSGYFNGTIDEVLILNRSLSAAQIKELYQSGASGKGWNITVSDETVVKDNWTVAVTAHDGSEDGDTVVSYNLEIKSNSPPTIAITSPANYLVTTDRTPTLTYVGTDVDGDTLVYDINITKFGSGLCSDTGLDVDDTYAANYTPSADLKCLADNNNYYNWSVRACENATADLFCSDYTAPRTINVSSLISINITRSFVNFSYMTLGETNNTSDNAPLPFKVENNGNARANISMNASQIWDSIIGASTYFRSKIRAFTGNATNANTTLFNMPLTGNVVFVNNLNYTDGVDSVEVDLDIEVPSDEPQGNKESLINFQASLSET